LTEQAKRAALVTGGSGDIGGAIAAKLVEMGYSVAIAGRSEERLAAAKEALAAGGRQVETFVCDVTVESQVDALAERAAQALSRIDVLVNAAGISDPGFIARSSVQHWETMMRTNVIGTILVCKAVLSVMRRQRSGHIINIGSLGAQQPRAGLAAYCASKAALASMAGALRKESERVGVRVSTVAPGPVDTRMHGAANPDAGKMIRPADVAEAVAFLLRLSPTAIVPELAIFTAEAF
jgi:short-subunit dehydrogenase